MYVVPLGPHSSQLVKYFEVRCNLKSILFKVGSHGFCLYLLLFHSFLLARALKGLVKSKIVTTRQLGCWKSQLPPKNLP